MWEGNINCYITQQWAMERLLKTKLDGTMQPELAESWETTSSGDNPNMVFHLRKGVKFHDGTDWNAQAAKWNLDKIKDGKLYGASSNFWKSIDVIDDYTLRITFTTWRNTFLGSWDNFFFVSPTAFEKNGIEWLRTHMVGTGPFMQTDYQRDVTTKLVRNPNYWNAGKPYLDGVQLLYVADELTREAMFKNSEADILDANVLQAERLSGQGYNIVTRADGAIALCPLNSKDANDPWSKLNVRLAAEYAIDKDGIAKAFGHGFAQAAVQIATPKSLAYDPSITGRKYDEAKARQLLSDAGYASGFATTIVVQPGNDRDLVIAIKNYWAKIGIRAEVQFPDSGAFNSIMFGPVTPNTIIFNGLTEFPNFNSTLAVFFSEGMFYKQMVKPDGFMDLYNKSLATPDQDAALLKQVSNALYNAGTVIQVIYSTPAFVLSSKVKDSGVLKQGSAFAYDNANVYLSK
jgi:ABC-type transport system substrate-binding protein